MADNQDEGDGSEGWADDGYQESGESTDPYMPPLDRLFQYSASENIYNRQMVGRSVVETLRIVHECSPDVARVMTIIEKTAKDPEAAVRGEMMEHLPHIMMVCHELGLPTWNIVDDLLPIVLCTITDLDNQVRKTAQTALLVLMEQNLISQRYAEEHLCPEIVNLTQFNEFTDYHPSIIALMSKMAPLLGSEITEQMFVPRFTALCSHNLVPIRKTCASNFGDFCAVVSRHVTETQLLPKFCELAKDRDWGVRKACAEVIMSVSCACCLQTRKAVLAQVFACLLADVMRWVRISAFQTLGPFITTFAEPSITGLAYNQQGELVLTNPEGFEFRFVSQKPEYSNLSEFMEDIGMLNALKKGYQDDSWVDEENKDSSSQSVEAEFNSFLFWREPLPDIDPDLTLSTPTPNTSDNVKHVDKKEDIPLNSTENESGESSSQLDSDNSLVCSHLASRQSNVHLAEPMECQPQQNIVPQPLIDHFVSMADPDHASSTDIDLAHHCAFSLPAVALTLGPAHWSLLRDTYTTLASDRQWKVRRTVASSIHELAIIVGEDVATQDLVPIFTGFIKDLDEVRIGALKHLAEFLKLLRPSGRNQFLPRLGDFLKMEYDYNWRFREELASQLLQAMCLFSPSDTCAHLTPVAVSLLLDNVAAVRQTALRLVTELVKQVSSHVPLLRNLLAELAEQFAHSSRWSRRQTFSLLCSRLVQSEALTDDLFARDVLPHLLDLSWDPVPNVRLAVARTLSVHIMGNQYYCNDQNPHHDVLLQALKRLLCDKDTDVRYYASLKTKPVVVPPTSLLDEFQHLNFSSTT